MRALCVYVVLALLSFAPLVLTQQNTDQQNPADVPTAPSSEPDSLPQATATDTQDVPNTYVAPTQGQQITAVPTHLEPSSGQSPVFSCGGSRWKVLLVGGVGLAAVGSLS